MEITDIKSGTKENKRVSKKKYEALHVDIANFLPDYQYSCMNPGYRKVFLAELGINENEFRNILEQPTFKPIEKQVQFWNYEKVEKLFNAEKDTHELRTQMN